MKKNLILVTILVLHTISVYADPSELLLKIDMSTGKEIIKHDVNTQIKTVFFKTSKDFISDMKISSNGNYVALIETKDGTITEGQYSTLPKNNMLILDKKGLVVRKISDNVQKFTFSPSGEDLAYINGSFFEGALGFKPEKVFILNIRSGTKENINEVDAPYDLNWINSTDG